MNRPHVIAAIVVATDVVATAALLLAPGLALLAVPWIAGTLVARRRPRGGAVVIALAAALVVPLAVVNLLHDPGWKDVQFDLISGGAALVALADAVRFLVLGGNRVTGLAHR